MEQSMRDIQFITSIPLHLHTRGQLRLSTELLPSRPAAGGIGSGAALAKGQRTGADGVETVGF